MTEAEIVARLRDVATGAAARNLQDDAAVWLPPLGRELVLTHDVIACGVHYLPDDDPSDIAWKLVAVNLSDLAAKGAVPSGVLIGLTLTDEDDAWIERFASGLVRVLNEHDTQLFGGDTVRAKGATSLGCTAIGHVARGVALARGGAQGGDDLWVTGTIGDAGLGLAIRQGEGEANAFLERRYRLPFPRLAVGQALFTAGVTAAMDVSDGLLIDADRMATASALALEIDLARVPLSDEAETRLSDGTKGRLQAATAGDDYELLFAAPSNARARIESLCNAKRLRVTRVGSFRAGGGLHIKGVDGEIVQAGRLGYAHD
ncbi:MAG: thiamine-phosphate kinase [Pacificimonas sp.]